MNVSCPECASVFRVDPAKIPEAGVRARCSVCGGIIPLAREAAAQSQSSGDAFSAAQTSAGGYAGEAGSGSFGGDAYGSGSGTGYADAGDNDVDRAGGSGSAAQRDSAYGAPAEPSSYGAPSGRSRDGFDAGFDATPAGSNAFDLSTSAADANAFDAGAPSAPTAPTPPAGRRPINPFLSNDPGLKAKRLARALVSDMVTYQPQKREEGLRNGTLKQLFRDEIKKSYEEYLDQVGRDTAESTTHFQEALNDILANGRKVF